MNVITIYGQLFGVDLGMIALGGWSKVKETFLRFVLFRWFRELYFLKKRENVGNKFLLGMCLSLTRGF